MINLLYSHGFIFVYDFEDWYNLRMECRIVGQIVGNSPFVPALPLKVLPEEALFLFDKGIANINTADINMLAENDKQLVFDLENELLEEQILQYKKIRKNQLEQIIDVIVEKRRKNGDTHTVQEILDDEVDKSTVITKDNMIWPLCLKSQHYLSSTSLAREDILKLTSVLKFNIYKDLWEKNYYITSGEKFGGDFLVYLGDPVMHHAIFIVKCVDIDKIITPAEIVAFGRLGTTVKKKPILGTFKDDAVTYLTVNWIDA